MYKNLKKIEEEYLKRKVSILVLMDLCIKTRIAHLQGCGADGFNPCFNGSMYKNHFFFTFGSHSIKSFNPCFNGSMYKNSTSVARFVARHGVSILVLMDLCIKTNSFSWNLPWDQEFQSLF